MTDNEYTTEELRERLKLLQDIVELERLGEHGHRGKHIYPWTNLDDLEHRLATLQAIAALEQDETIWTPIDDLEERLKTLQAIATLDKDAA